LLPGRAVTKRDLRSAWLDILNGWSHRRLWATMAMQDIRKRYRRSKIGPFWLTISMGIMVSALGMLYGTLFKLDVRDFLPYVASGFVIWGLISTFILDGTKAFIEAEGLIKQLPVPLSTHVYRDIWRNLIVFAHNIWIYIGVSVWFDVFPGPGALLALVGLAVLAVNALWVGLLFGLVSARFRDVPQIVASVVQVSFFLTPIIWKAEMLPDRAAVLMWNPFYHYLHIVRGPLLGDYPSLYTWVIVLAMTVIGWAATLFVYSKYRWRIPYWV
jgi:ABC-2 type transport system permease protein/lipopolysaccharide transport system permease protein